MTKKLCCQSEIGLQSSGNGPSDRAARGEYIIVEHLGVALRYSVLNVHLIHRGTESRGTRVTRKVAYQNIALFCTPEYHCKLFVSAQNFGSINTGLEKLQFRRVHGFQAFSKLAVSTSSRDHLATDQSATHSDRHASTSSQILPYSLGSSTKCGQLFHPTICHAQLQFPLSILSTLFLTQFLKDVCTSNKSSLIWCGHGFPSL